MANMSSDTVYALEQALGDYELTDLYENGNITAEDALTSSLKLSVMEPSEIIALGDMYSTYDLVQMLLDDSVEASMEQVIITPIEETTG